MPSSVINHEYKDHAIVYSEDDGVWRCDDLDISAPQLATIKKRIDELSRKNRSLDVPALMIKRDINRDYSTDDARIVDVTVTMLCEKTSRYGSQDVWISYLDGGKKRAKVRLDLIYPVAARAELQAWLRDDKAARKATETADKAFENIASHDADSLMLAKRETAPPKRAGRI